MSVKQRLVIVGSLLLAVGGLAVAQQPTLRSQVPEDLSIAMQAKLGSSQKIVEGLTSGNYDLITKGAEGLRGICESQAWRTREDQVYTHYRDELHRSATKLMTMAQDENLDGAAYTYMHTLTTCINCHQYSRDVLRIAENHHNSTGVISIPVTDEPMSTLRR